MSTVKGRKPLSKKSEALPINYDAVFGNRLHIPHSVQKEFDQNGWTPRWLNAQDVYKNQGHHPQGWHVYKPKSGTITDGFGESVSPAKEIRRGDLILGYKTQEEANLHKQFLRQKAERYTSENNIRQQAAALKKAAGGAKVSVETGLNDNDE